MLVSNNILDAQLQNFLQQTYFQTYQTYHYNRNTLNQGNESNGLSFQPFTKSVVNKTGNDNKQPQITTNERKRSQTVSKRPQISIGI